MIVPPTTDRLRLNRVSRLKRDPKKKRKQESSEYAFRIFVIQIGSRPGVHWMVARPARDGESHVVEPGERQRGLEGDRLVVHVGWKRAVMMVMLRILVKSILN